jgi:hypothetical protein
VARTNIMALEVYICTTGEDTTWRVIERVAKYTPHPYALRIWYNVLEEYDDSFVRKMLEYTDDVVVCRKGMGCSEGSMFFQLTSEAEFQLGMCADTQVREDYFDKLMKPMVHIPRMAFTGQGFPIEEGSDILIPDKIGLVRMEAIRDVGAHSPLFKRYGHQSLELGIRMRKAGWRILGVPDVLLEDYEVRQGKSKMKGFNELIEKNGKLCEKVVLEGCDKFNWWSNTFS